MTFFLLNQTDNFMQWIQYIFRFCQLDLAKLLSPDLSCAQGHTPSWPSVTFHTSLSSLGVNFLKVITRADKQFLSLTCKTKRRKKTSLELYFEFNRELEINMKNNDYIPQDIWISGKARETLMTSAETCHSVIYSPFPSHLFIHWFLCLTYSFSLSFYLPFTHFYIHPFSLFSPMSGRKLLAPSAFPPTAESIEFSNG